MGELIFHWSAFNDLEPCCGAPTLQTVDGIEHRSTIRIQDATCPKCLEFHAEHIARKAPK